MVDVAAQPIPTQVVDPQALRDKSVHRFVGSAVRQLRPDPAVALGVLVARVVLTPKKRRL